MSIKLKVNENLRTQIETMVKELNALIKSGKENIYREDAQNLINKFGLNELLSIGCKQHKLPNMIYLELPQKEISEDKVESVLFSLDNLMQNN